MTTESFSESLSESLSESFSGFELLREVSDVLWLLEARGPTVDAELRRLPKTERDSIKNFWASLLALDRRQFRELERAFLAGKERPSVEERAQESYHVVTISETPSIAISVTLAEATTEEMQTMVHLAFWKDSYDRKQLADEINWRAREHYEAVLGNQMRAVGCDPARVRLEENSELSVLRERSDWAAASIVDTYNRDLRTATNRIVDQWVAEKGSLKGLNRNILAYRVREWSVDRAEWKDRQIVITEATAMAHRAASQFLHYNGIGADVWIVPVTAVCEICQALVDGSPYTPEQARMLNLPAHPGCPHALKAIVDPDTVPPCADVWRGQRLEELGVYAATREAWDDIVRLVREGGPGSGHHGHRGIPGQRGGSIAGGGVGGFEGSAGFSDLGGAAGRALGSGDIAFDSGQYAKMSPEDRRATVAHEIAHQTVERYVLADPEKGGEWDRATDALTVKMVQHRQWGEMPLFFGGNLTPGEAISDAIGVRIAFIDSRPDSVSLKVWNWAGAVIGRAGYDPVKLATDVDHVVTQLDAQLV